MNLNSISINTPAVSHNIQAQSLSDEDSKNSDLPFSSIVTDLIQSTDAQQQTVALDVHKLATGEADNLQTIAANIAQADLSFRFLMEMRDKLITSYQEVMRMQV